MPNRLCRLWYNVVIFIAYMNIWSLSRRVQTAVIYIKAGSVKIGRRTGRYTPDEKVEKTVLLLHAVQENISKIFVIRMQSGATLGSYLMPIIVYILIRGDFGDRLGLMGTGPCPCARVWLSCFAGWAVRINRDVMLMYIHLNGLIFYLIYTRLYFVWLFSE